ncbi:MAG: hypothetical protein ITD33_02410 [Nitrosarchaeum sp.]|nr:hypothetical protein [Nitrosarchaeum sp.]MBP0119701.1 hypothetical protein [Nitrosarchaeum sp.]
MIQILKTVFSNPIYIVLTSTIFTLMLISLLILSGYVFLEPYLVGNIQKGTEFGFVLIILLSFLSALVIPMNIYRINILKKSKTKITGSIFTSFIGAATGACSCGPIGFALVSSIGSIGATALSFLTNFEIPIRIFSIGLLGLTYFTTIKSLKIECNI